MAFGFLRDIFDANTESDQKKRLARGGKRLYADDEKARGNARPGKNVGDNAKNVGVNIAKGVVSTPWWWVKTTVVNPAKQVAGSLTGNKVAERNAREDQFKGAKDIKGALAQTGFRTVDLASNLLLPGSGKIAGAGASLGKKALTSAAVNAGVGGVTTGLEDYALTGKVDPKKAAQGALFGAVIGGALEVAPDVYKGFKNIDAKTKAAIETRAAEASGLNPNRVINQNEAGTLRDFVDYQTGSYRISPEEYNTLNRQARNAAQTAGIDITTGSPEEIGQRVYSYLDQLGKHTQARESILQGGYAKLPGKAEELATITDSGEVKRRLEGNVDPANLDTKSAAVAMTKDPLVIQRLLAEPEVPKRTIPPQGIEVADAYAGELKAFDDSVKGGQMIPDGEGGYRRTTEHTPFYSEYYKANGRPPSAAAYKEQALKELESGRAPSTYQPYFNDAINPETQALLAAADEGQLNTRQPVGEVAQQPVAPEDQQIKDILESGTGSNRDASLRTIEQNQGNMTDAERLAAAGGDTGQAGQMMEAGAKSDKLAEFRAKAAAAKEGTPPPEVPAAPKPSMEGDGRTRKLGFIKNVEESGTTNATGREAVESIAQKEYKQKGNAAPISNARKFVQDDPEGAFERFKTTENIREDDVILGQALMEKFQKENRKSDFVDVVEKLAEGGLGAGRTAQAFSVWSRLSPEGIAMLAERKIARKRASIAGGELERQAKGLAKELQDEVENAVRLDKGDVKDTLRSIIRDVEKEELSTGQKIAKKVERTVTPKVKKQADTLVNEITKKIKEEQMAPLPKANKRPAIDVLREVFGRNKEAQEAFPEAQMLLREKFADNPKALEQLDQFFNSELGLPAASTTINTAIKEQLKTNGARVSEIINKSWVEQKRSVDEIAEALTKEGFDPVQAKSLADEVVTRLNKQIGDAKSVVLERLAGDVPEKARSTYVDRLNKLSNLGALDEGDYLKVARAKLDLPQLTPEIAGRLSDASQRLQGLAIDDVERYKVIKEIGEIIEEAAPPEKPGIITQVLGAPRSMLASFDISGMGRQGLALGTRYQKEYAKAFKTQVGNFASEEKFNNAMARIAADKRADLMDRSGLALTGVKGYGKPEEAFASSLPEYIPLFGRGIKGSDRAYTGALTQFRADVFNTIMDKLEASGVDINAMPKEHLESIGKFINTSSGRGVGKAGGYFEKHANGLALALFSPRLWKSRLDMLNPKYYYDLKGPARKLALQNAATFASTAAVVLGLAAAAGAEVETDARSSDFLKIKTGDTRFDILGGFQQNLVFAWRQISGEKKSSVTGKVTDLDEGGFGTANRLSILSDLIQNKENPTLAAAQTQLKGTDKAGNKLTGAARVGEIAKLGAPISLFEAVKGVKEEGAVGLAKNVPGFVGVGVGTYGLKDIQPTDKQKEYIADLKSHEAPKEQIEATKAFYQTLKVGPDRQKISGEVSEAIKNGDLKKAKQLADDYNKEYAENFKDWKKQHGKYASDKALLEAFNKGKIKLTKASVKSRARSGKSIYEATRGQ